VAGHGNALAFGYLGTVVDVPVVVMLGRVQSLLLARSISLVDAQSETDKFHAYEGHPLSTVTYPIRLFSRLGVSNIIRMCIAPPLPSTY